MTHTCNIAKQQLAVAVWLGLAEATHTHTHTRTHTHTCTKYTYLPIYIHACSRTHAYCAGAGRAGGEEATGRGGLAGAHLGVDGVGARVDFPWGL